MTPTKLAVDLDCEDVPVVVEVVLGLDSGRLDVMGLELLSTGCIPHEITATTLRAVKLGAIVARIGSVIGKAERQTLREGGTISRHVLLRGEASAALPRSVSAISPPKRTAEKLSSFSEAEFMEIIDLTTADLAAALKPVMDVAIRHGDER